MNHNAFMWLYIKFENMLVWTQHWVASSALQELRSTKYVASFGVAFMIVAIIVLLVNLTLVWTPSLWNVRGSSQAITSRLELTPYVRHTELAGQRQRSVPNFLPDSNDLEVTEEEVVDVYNHLPTRKRPEGSTEGNEVEAMTSLRAARHMTELGKYEKALKLFQHALILDPSHADVLTEYGEFLENHKQDFVKADHMYSRALVSKPDHSQVILHFFGQP